MEFWQSVARDSFPIKWEDGLTTVIALPRQRRIAQFSSGQLQIRSNEASEAHSSEKQITDHRRARKTNQEPGIVLPHLALDSTQRSAITMPEDVMRLVYAKRMRRCFSHKAERQPFWRGSGNGLKRSAPSV